MIKKENFVKLINAVILQMKKNAKFSNSIEEFSDSFCYFDITEELITSILDILESEIGDITHPVYGSVISWWLFDMPEAGKNKDSCCVKTDEGKIILETPEQLYDFLVGDNKISWR